MFFHITLFLIYSSFIRYYKYTPYKLKQEKSLLCFVLFNERQPPKLLLLAFYIGFLRSFDSEDFFNLQEIFKKR